MAQVKLKDETERITFNGRSADITREALVPKFVVTEDEPKTKANGKGEKE